ncbi:Plant intracellular Ras-group-related LRR protein 6 (Intracellular Ras-group-related LRR protein 6) (OsIRL6), partial [Durusdinium trenchii]
DADDRSAVLRAAEASGQLEVSGRGWKSLPDLPRSLKLLDISKNQLTGQALLAAWHRSWPEHCQLQILRAAENCLGDEDAEGDLVPTILSSLQLRELDLSHNGLQLRQLGAWSGLSAARLSFLDFTGNPLSSAPLPALVLEVCPHLQELRLRRCGLTHLDVRLEPHGLGTLDLEENRLTSLPPELLQALPRLKALLLANNELRSSLPTEFGFWESLQVVSLTGNPLRALRQALLAKGWPAVAQHLRDRAPEQVTVEPEPLTGRPGAEAASRPDTPETARLVR